MPTCHASQGLSQSHCPAGLSAVGPQFQGEVTLHPATHASEKNITCSLFNILRNIQVKSSIRIKFYNGIVWFLSDHSKAEITHSMLIFMAMTQNHGDTENHGSQPKFCLCPLYVHVNYTTRKNK